MGRLLFIRVSAVTYDENKVSGVWPKLHAMVWPDPYGKSAGSPTVPVRAAMGASERGVMGLAHLVDSVTTSGGVGWPKPDQRIFLAACEQAGVSPDQALMIGDDYAADIEGALAAGLRALWLVRSAVSSETGTAASLDEVIPGVTLLDGFDKESGPRATQAIGSHSL